MRILFITTSTNAVRTLLEQNSLIQLKVVDCAKCETREKLFMEILSERSIDTLLTYRCPWILPETIFSRAKLGAFNIHPSLLPLYKGLNPWDEMFKHHEKVGGVTLHQITTDVDAGPIIAQLSYDITPCDTIDTARQKADMIAAQIIKTFILQPHCHTHLPN